jgi:hypothetical protein
VKDEHGAGDGPAESEVTVVPVGPVCCYTMGAALEPGGDVRAHVGPEEAASDSVKSLMAPEVATSGVSVKNGEDILTKAGWDVNEEDVTLEASLMDHANAMVVED